MIARLVPGILMLTVMVVGCGKADNTRRQALARTATLAERLRIADVTAGRRLFGQCLACHTIAPGELDRAGPNLHAIMGKPVAGGSVRYGYTVALSRVGGRWDAATMDAWLASPARFAPGTTMTFVGLSDPLDRADVIAYLQAEGR